jgi:lipoate-protein ligase A
MTPVMVDVISKWRGSFYRCSFAAMIKTSSASTKKQVGGNSLDDPLIPVIIGGYLEREGSMETTTWRILITPPASGDWNMAVDEAVLESVGQNRVPATLRLFAWQPPCLSLGYAQPVSDVDFTALQLNGWGLVRRPTGGRAILHTDELTYSVIAPLKEERVYGSIIESYRRLSQALLEALQLIGLPARADKDHTLPENIKSSGPVCFEVPSNYEITFDGKKLIGSAQARRREGVLQHGSDEAARTTAGQRLLERAVTVENCIHRLVTWQEAAQAFQTGFERALNLVLLSSALTPWEEQRAAELVAKKYGHPVWTNRV